MLARCGRLPASGDYADEVKWDGFRAIVSTEGELRVRSRRTPIVAVAALKSDPLHCNKRHIRVASKAGRHRDAAGWAVEGRHRMKLRVPLAARILGAASVIAAALIGPGVGRAATPFSTGEWHRLNAAQSNPAPEHERFQCVEGFTWTCLYDKVPEPALNFSWNAQQGSFTGVRTPRGAWACPAWFPSSVCASVFFVAQGTASYGPVAVFSIREDLVVTKVGAQQRMWAYWVDQRFVCPWYRTFDEALAANPFPLPFDGTDWPAQDCTFG
jgi:hypothetical protein